jgi:hypothetical protein
MTTEDLHKRLNAISAYMGGPQYLYEKHFSDMEQAAFEKMISLDDLKFNESWDWLIPVWSKLRFDLSPMAVISCIDYIDQDKINDLFMLLSDNAIAWCKQKGYYES